VSRFSSGHGAHRALRWRDWGIAWLAAWLAPFGVGISAILLGPILLLPLLSGMLPDAGLDYLRLLSWVVATALFISPAFTWIGLLVLLLLSVPMLALGRFGWLSAIIAGAAAGLLATGLLGGMGAAIGPVFGAGAALVFRAVLKARRPELF